MNGFSHYNKEQAFVDIGFRKLWDKHFYICAQETRLRLQSLWASQQQLPQHGCSDGYNEDWQNYCRPSCRAILLKRKWSSKSFFGREVCWFQHVLVCILTSWKLNSYANNWETWVSFSWNYHFQMFFSMFWKCIQKSIWNPKTLRFGRCVSFPIVGDFQVPAVKFWRCPVDGRNPKHPPGTYKAL